MKALKPLLLLPLLALCGCAGEDMWGSDDKLCEYYNNCDMYCVLNGACRNN